MTCLRPCFPAPTAKTFNWLAGSVRSLLTKVDMLEAKLSTLSASSACSSSTVVPDSVVSSVVEDMKAFDLHKVSGTLALLGQFNKDLMSKVRLIENGIGMLWSSNAMCEADPVHFQDAGDFPA